jgi:RP/EB family microtubule-associated protein
MTESIGMMEGAYFVSKKDILIWVNKTYKLDMIDINEATNGALYCQIIDSIHQGKVKMSKVNWKAKQEHEIIQNYKILQQALMDNKINKYLEVAKLMKGRTQENLELLQWLKKYYEVNRPAGEYDAEKRRKGMDLNTSRDTSKNKEMVSNKRNISKERILKTIPEKENNGKLPSKSTEKNTSSSKSVLSYNDANIVPIKIGASEIKELEDKIKELELKLEIANYDLGQQRNDISLLNASLSDVGKEKDFYFHKLRDIEMLNNKFDNIDIAKYRQFINFILSSDKEIEIIQDEDGIPSLKKFN